MHANGDMKHCAIIQWSRLYLFISSATLFCYGGGVGGFSVNSWYLMACFPVKYTLLDLEQINVTIGFNFSTLNLDFQKLDFNIEYFKNS